MKNKIIVLAILLLCSCSPINKHYNNFSEFKEGKQYSDIHTPIRIFFDRQGMLYTDQPLNISKFYDAQSLLTDYYKDQKDELQRVFVTEDLLFTESNNITKNIEILQNHLCEKYIKKINTVSADKKLVFLIHGYNNTGETASTALEKLRVAILKKYPQEKFQFVEIYWDGLTKRNNPLNSGRIWDNAQYSSARAGLELRRILNSIEKTESYVITHSHGASVITEALFNVRRFKDKFYKHDDDGIDITRLQAIYNTPTSKFIVGMLAPAIPGYNVFCEYYERTVAGVPKIITMSNYRFINGFNKYDIATTKGVFPRFFGATTLACKEQDHEDVENIFNNNTAIYSRSDFSADKQNKQRSHAVVKYIENPNFDSFLASVLE